MAYDLSEILGDLVPNLKRRPAKAKTMKRQNYVKSLANQYWSEGGGHNATDLIFREASTPAFPLEKQH